MTPQQRKQMEELAAKQCAAVVNMCEEIGYPTSDEPLCLLVQDVFVNGYSSAVSEMEDAAGKEFDSTLAYDVANNTAKVRCKDFIAGARWQHSQDFALIAKLKAEIERLKEGK